MVYEGENEEKYSQTHPVDHMQYPERKCNDQKIDQHHQGIQSMGYDAYGRKTSWFV